jgi:hypothetical protein
LWVGEDVSVSRISVKVNKHISRYHTRTWLYVVTRTTENDKSTSGVEGLLPPERQHHAHSMASFIIN